MKWLFQTKKSPISLSIIVAFIVPVLVVSFESHKLLFNFDYTALEHDADGVIDFEFFFQAEAIHFFFIYFTFFVLSFIEAKYNKLDLRVVYKSNSKMEILSWFVIFFWGIFCLLSSVTVLPKVGTVKKMIFVHASMRSININMDAIKIQLSLHEQFWR